jgi:hypothetical protein
VFKLTHNKLSPIIGDDVVGHAKPVHDLSNEFHQLSSYNRSYKLYFDLFCEFIHYYKDVRESSFDFL